MSRAVVVAASLLLAGCGFVLSDGLTVRPLLEAECDLGGLPEPAEDLVLLNWDGGGNPLYPDFAFSGIEPALFAIDEGGTLADWSPQFRERVREQVTRIFCDSSDIRVRVEHFTAELAPGATIIHVVQDVSPSGSGRIGEAEYDPCNMHRDDLGIVYAEQIAQRVGDRSFDEWVTIFANTIAHEIGHTVGYGHVERDAAPEEGRSLFVEIMFASHTLDELIREQRFLVEQDTCPRDLVAAVKETSAVVSCHAPPHH